MILLVFITIICLDQTAFADIFKADKNDYQMTSVYDEPYHFKRETVKPLMTWSLDRHEEINKSIYKLSREKINEEDIKNTQLLLWEYGAPAEADAFKHFQTMAYLRFTLDYERLKDLEDNNKSGLSALRKQSLYECINGKFLHSFKNNLSELLESCQDSQAFHDLNFADGVNVYEKLFNKFNLRGELKEDILAILPRWYILREGIDVQGPLKRIGHVLKKHKNNNVEDLTRMLQQYQEEKNVSRQDIDKFSLPIRPFTIKDVVFLLSLDEEVRAQSIQTVSAELAINQALDDYGEAIEWMGRYVDHPGLEDVYKNIMYKGIVFLEKEKQTLKEEIKHIKDYDAVVNDMIQKATEEQEKILKEQKTQEQYKSLFQL